ncbi:MAG TPA: alpha/beta hydrolase fold domain-containing protein [Ensifer sp.]|nr:alpha/beta hydrolase fold domain-containing protein [Ensifer sp.]
MTTSSFAIRLALTACILGAVSAPVYAAGRLAALSACRQDYRTFCRDVPMGGGRVAACLGDHRNELSPACRAAVTGGDTAAVKPGTVRRNLAYGADPAQKLDVYVPAAASKAPVIVMMHGGAWALGSKSAQSVVDAKAAHWLPRGYVFVSVETRLLPAANPLEQAHDLAAALAYVRKHAAEWGGDGGRIVLMGHSAGAHLAALLEADPSLGGKSAPQPVLGTVSLDSAAYDVTQIMSGRHMGLYDRAFGSDPAFWRAASPSLQVRGKPAPALLVCSSRRRESCDQAAGFAAILKRAGARATVLPQNLSHMDINAELGKDGAYTAAVDKFLASLGLP